MKLGINLPWGSRDSFGWDIGPQAVAVDGSTQSASYLANRMVAPGANGDKTHLDTRLASLKSIGISCVRLYLFCDGVNLTPPTFDGKRGQWQVPSFTLDPTHVSEFRTILEACVRQNMQIMPVFVDFNLFAPPAIMIQHSGGPGDKKASSNAVFITPPVVDSVDQWVKTYYANPTQKNFENNSNSVDWHKFIKGGRAPILRAKDQVDAFLNSALLPLLNVAASQADFKRQILAWDILSEPEVAIENAQKSTKYGGWLENLFDSVTGIPIAYFIQQSAKLIFSAQMNATVGFQTAMPLGQDDGFKSQHLSDFVGQQISEITKVVTQLLLPQQNFLPQCHYYPKDSAGDSGQNKLLSKDSFKLKAGSTLLLGEFATKIDDPTPGNSPWGTDIPGDDSVLARLQVAKNKGYDWAFPWSATNGLERSRFDDPTQTQFKKFQS